MLPRVIRFVVRNIYSGGDNIFYLKSNLKNFVRFLGTVAELMFADYKKCIENSFTL